MSATSSARPKTVRADLGEVIAEVFSRQWLLEFAEQVKSMASGVWATGVCPECGSQRKVRVDVPDIKGQLAALTELMEQAEGRPGIAGDDPAGITIVVQRTWPPAAHDAADDSHGPAA